MPTHRPTPQTDPAGLAADLPADLPAELAPAPWLTRRARLGIATLVCVLLALTGLTAPARAAVTVTPRDFTGYGFDQCVTPTQSAMDAWLRSSPFWAVGIYISGKSRACRTQPNQTPAWIRTQLANGWRLLPITLGPQASCNPRFPRYNDDVRINASSTRSYRAARLQGRAEASSTVQRAQELGIGKGSTLWYDMEAYDSGNTACRESALSFLSAWTNRLHKLDYVSGVYSSAGSGIVDLDNARVNRPDRYTMPDQIWIARWDGVANTSTSYIRSDGWLPGGRMKQYLGGHNETWGGVTINIDSNWLDLGSGKAPAPKSYCGGVRLSFRTYPVLREGATGDRVSALQCLLQTRGTYGGKVTGTLDAATMDAAVAWRTSHGMDTRRVVGKGAWTSLHAAGISRIIKTGGAGERVRRLQRALNATGSERLAVTGLFASGTTAAVKRYQKDHDLARSGVVTPAMWTKLANGKY